MNAYVPPLDWREQIAVAKAAPTERMAPVTDATEVRTTVAAILAATSAALNPSPDVSGCPDTVARLAIPAVLRAYADAEHHFGEGFANRVDYGTGTEYDAYCVCGASWGEDGCTERERLLAVAAQVEAGNQ